MIFVTGANGFIGRNVTRQLRLDGYDVMTCDFENADVLPTALLCDEIDKIVGLSDVIFHMGAISSTTKKDISQLSKWNIDCSSRLIEYATKRKKKIVYASSASVYGDGKDGFSEKSLHDVRNQYAASKSVIDKFVELKLRDAPSSDIVGLRYFNVYGSGEISKKDMASPIHKFLHQSKKGVIRLFEGSENFYRDFVHIDDVVKMTIATLHVPSGIYNIGTGHATTFSEIAEMVSGRTGAKIESVPFPERLAGKYQKFTKADMSKSLTSGIPPAEIDIEKGIQIVFEEEC